MDEDALNDLKISINNSQVELQMHEVSRKNAEDTLNTVIRQLGDMLKKAQKKVDSGEINMEEYKTMKNESRQQVAAMKQTLMEGVFMEDACRQYIKNLEDKLNSSIQQNKSDGSIGSEEFGGNPDGKEINLDEFSLESTGAPTVTQTVTPTGTPTPFKLTYDKSMELSDDAFHFTGGKRRPKKKKRRKKKRKTKGRKKKRKTKRKERPKERPK